MCHMQIVYIACVYRCTYAGAQISDICIVTRHRVTREQTSAISFSVALLPKARHCTLRSMDHYMVFLSSCTFSSTQLKDVQKHSIIVLTQFEKNFDFVYRLQQIPLLTACTINTNVQVWSFVQCGCSSSARRPGRIKFEFIQGAANDVSTSFRHLGLNSPDLQATSRGSSADTCTSLIYT